jgi:Helix-turn-helix domain
MNASHLPWSTRTAHSIQKVWGSSPYGCASPLISSDLQICGSKSVANLPPQHFINPHRLFHGVWLPQWLEERPEVSEKAKKLYAYLTYFAGGKGYSWPSFGLLAEKLHCSRRHVMRLVHELSAHRLISVTNVSKPGSRPLCQLLSLSLASLDADRARREFRFGNDRKPTAR